MTWYLYELYNPLDSFEHATVPVSEWFRHPEVWDSIESRTALLVAARQAFVKAKCPLGPLRVEPHVVYIPLNEGVYFIFKEDNNGTTYLASTTQLTSIPEYVNHWRVHETR